LKNPSKKKNRAGGAAQGKGPGFKPQHTKKKKKKKGRKWAFYMQWNFIHP
jgi:hypothetical protein